MTEQEKRALEMAHSVCKHRCTMCGISESRPLICELFDNCLLLVSIGYRKEEEVRKEMARKLYEWLKTFYWYGYHEVDEEDPYFVSKVDSYSIKSFIKKEFGVEVEE